MVEKKWDLQRDHVKPKIGEENNCIKKPSRIMNYGETSERPQMDPIVGRAPHPLKEQLGNLDKFQA